MKNIKDVKLELDQRLKACFEVKKELLIPMINSLFDINLPLDTEIQLQPNESFVEINGKNVKRITDIEFIIKSTTDKAVRYHIEFQLQNYKNMALRMFSYARTHININNESNTITLPKQLVMCIRPEDYIDTKEYLQANIANFGDRDEIFRVPIFKLWEHDVYDLYRQELYLLMPFALLKYENVYDVDALQREYDCLVECCRNLENITLSKLNPGENSKPIFEDEIAKIQTNAFHIISYIMAKNSKMDYSKFTFKEETTMIALTVEDAKRLGIQIGETKGEARGEARGMAKREQELKEQMESLLYTGKSPEEIYNILFTKSKDNDNGSSLKFGK